MRRQPVTIDRHAEPWSLAAPVLEGLTTAGHVAVFVGGCVRDHWLGRPVTDLDCATDASPDQVAALFPRCVTVGRRFGVTVVPVPGGQIEVAAFRSDAAYIDGRRPTSVHPATEAEDVARRDFTCNALVLDPDAGEIRDHVGGLDDLARRRLVVVGDPEARLREDRLRVLRGLRFAAHLDLQIDPATAAALRAVPLGDLSRERIWEEWHKAVADARRAAWARSVAEYRLAGELCPLFATEGIDEPVDLDDDCPALPAIAACCRRCPPDALADWLRTQPISRTWRQTLPWLVAYADPERWPAGVAARRRLLLDPRAADLAPLLAAAAVRDPAAGALLAELRALRADPPTPWLSGGDLRDLGIPAGPELGRIRAALWDAQLAGELDDRRAAVARARTLFADRDDRSSAARTPSGGD